MTEVGPVEKAHRLLAPRIVYLIGTKSPDGAMNVIPVSNVTSVSTRPQHILLAVFKRWTTYHNLLAAEGFTVSVPLFGQLRGVWALGAKYSRFPVAGLEEKLAASGLAFDYRAVTHGPVLTDGIGWLDCRIISTNDLGGDHGIVIGSVVNAWFNPTYLEHDGTPRGDIHPLMQWTGNLFATAGDRRSIPYFDDGSSREA